MTVDTQHVATPAETTRGSQLNRRLLEGYGEHYQRLNRSVLPEAMKPRQRRSLQRTLGHLVADLPAGSRVVDIGCGTGHLLHWLCDYRQLALSGVDQSEEQLVVARESLAGVEFARQDGLDFLRAQVGTFDGIFCFDVLEHIPGEDHLLEWMEAARGALRPGGFLCCRCPNGANVLASYSRYVDLTHQRMFTRTSMTQLYEAAGFIDPQVVPLRPGWWLAALRMRAEAWFHRMLFHLCGRRPESVITTNVCLVGYRQSDLPSGQHDQPDTQMQRNQP